MKRFRAFVILAILAAIVVMPAAGALAQEKVATRQDSSAQAEKFDVEKRKQDVQIFLDKIEILGRIEKPQTVFIIQGKDPAVDDIQIDRSFFQEIFRRVEWDNTRKIVEKSMAKRRRK